MLTRALGRGLTNSRSLQKLYLSHNMITDDCIQHLMRGVINSPLQTLDLSSNQIKDRGAGIIGHALRSPESKLQEVDLTNNFIEIKGLNELHVGLVSNRKIISLKVAMNVGIPHANLLKIKSTIERNR